MPAVRRRGAIVEAGLGPRAAWPPEERAGMPAVRRPASRYRSRTWTVVILVAEERAGMPAVRRPASRYRSRTWTVVILVAEERAGMPAVRGSRGPGGRFGLAEARFLRHGDPGTPLRKPEGCTVCQWRGKGL